MLFRNGGILHEELHQSSTEMVTLLMKIGEIFIKAIAIFQEEAHQSKSRYSRCALTSLSFFYTRQIVYTAPHSRV